MKNKFNKSYKLLSLFSLSNLETYLQELVCLGFEYASNFILTYNMNSFKSFPVGVPSRHLLDSNDAIGTFFYLTNSYLSKDPFYSFLYYYLISKFKIKFSQFSQIMFMRGGSSTKNCNKILFSDLRYGLTYKDFVLSSFKTRSNIIDSSVNVYTSGYLTRKLIEGLRNIHIKDINCKTKYNCVCPVTNEIIHIPFLCSNNRSICSSCLNIGCKFHIFMGVNKGVVSGQALGEPSTQMLLRTFHFGAEVIGSQNIEPQKDYDPVIADYFNRLISSSINFKFYIIDDLDSLNIVNNITSDYYYLKFKCYNNITISKWNLSKYCTSLYNKFSKIWSLILLDKKNMKLNSVNENFKINYSPTKIYSY